MTRIKPMLARKVGHVPFKSFSSKGKKGQFLASTTFNGKEYVGTGDTQRLATLDLNKTIDQATKDSKLAQTEFVGE